uniref:Uncharacterized protein n=1 Tax=Rhizophagus irregularis (strain DAOM 181602 / DAOM 197198 / MUCL 43194) TaxID=747089 RepID=U9TEA9_RHIID
MFKHLQILSLRISKELVRVDMVNYIAIDVKFVMQIIPSENISGHPIARKLTETFAAMTVAGSRPRNFINRFNEWRSKI